MNIHVTIAIPTKDRRLDLTRLLTSLRAQERLPDDIIVVDGSEESIEYLVEEFSDLPIRYFRCLPPSLPRQRNKAIKELLPNTDWVGFLDDDLELLPDSIRKLEEFIKEKKLVAGGVGLSILNQAIPKAGIFNSIFLLEKGNGAKITASGFPASIRTYNYERRADWLYGGATFWSTQILKNYSFDEWFSGTGYMEDVDFSYQVAKKYPLWISTAGCYHFSHPILMKKEVGIGEWQICSLWYFSRKTRNYPVVLTTWSCLGITLKNALTGVARLDRSRIRRFAGNVKGVARLMHIGQNQKQPLVFHK